MAKKAKVTIYDWLVNDNPKNPGCSMCFYNSDCDKCFEIVASNRSLYDMYTVNRYILDNIIAHIVYDKEYVKVIDEIHEFLEGVVNVEESDDSRGNRSSVRKRQKKGKKKANVRGKRTRRRKSKKDVEEHGEEETPQENSTDAKEE